MAPNAVSELQARPNDSADSLARQAEDLFAKTPRTEEPVEQALQHMLAARKAASKESDAHFRYTFRSALFAIWLAYHSEKKAEVTKFSSQAIKLADEAIGMQPDSVQGYYYRAIATGLLAEQHKSAGKEAMHHIRSDALKAIELAPDFDHGGPHRLLGALYLRAPGPPSGIGSRQRALKHLEQAAESSPSYPENQLFLAEALLATGNRERARALLEQILQSDESGGVLYDRQKCKQRAMELLTELDK